MGCAVNFRKERGADGQIGDEVQARMFFEASCYCNRV